MGCLGQRDIEIEFERRMIEAWWPEMGIEIIKRYDKKEEQETKGDFRIVYKEKEYNVDIKAEKEVPPNFPIELIQDVMSMDMGWWYKLKECDYIFYGQFDKSWNLPCIYTVDFNKLGNYDFEEGWPKPCAKGYGLTIFWAVPLIVLTKRGIAKKKKIETQHYSNTINYKEK